MIRYYDGQYKAVADVFHNAIHLTTSEHYSEEQILAWAPVPIDYNRWRARCDLKRPFLYCLEDEIIGFIELDPDGHIDCHYVHPVHNRKGIGTALLRHVLQVATAAKLPRLYVEASHVAKNLYLQHNFSILAENHVTKGTVTLVNWQMERRLPH